jgi:hypothetical protein
MALQKNQLNIFRGNSKLNNPYLLILEKKYSLITGKKNLKPSSQCPEKR